MTFDDLKNNDNLIVSEYDDYNLYAESLEVGGRAWKVSLDNTDEIYEMKVVHAISREDDPEYYDSIDGYDILSEYDGDYDESGEFITDEDVIYAFLSNCEEE